MAIKRRPLTVYRIRDTIGGIPVRDFEDAIAPTDELTVYKLVGDHDFDARLFVDESKAKPPSWLEFLESGFGQLPGIADSVTNRAVLIAKVRYEDQDCFFAFPFGFGRYLLKRNSFVPNYGLRVALNAFYPSDGSTAVPDWACVQSVDAKTVAVNTLHMRLQMDRQTTFEAFGIDVQCDMLRVVTGRPIDAEIWGPRLTGASALRLNCKLDISGLGGLLVQVEETHRLGNYRAQFEWIDSVRAVTNPDIIADLEDRLLERLKNKDTGNLELSLPQLVEWDEIAGFLFSVKSAEQHDDLQLGEYLDVLTREKKLADLTVQQLRQSHRVEVVNVQDQIAYKWSVFKCISGELALNGTTYLIHDGDFFAVSESYLDELNGYIQGMRESDKALPASTAGLPEAEYNERAASASPDYLLLDKKTVRVTTRTSSIEICDIFTSDGCFIHVKRRLGSACLSHLFAQGYVSADLFRTSREYRVVMRDKIQEAEEERVAATGDGSLLGRFSSFDPSHILTNGYEVIYAIVADWNGRALVDALPFFSKVNLRRHTLDLQRMGYRVSYKRVAVEAVSS